MGLGPITEDVRFDHGAAQSLISLCNAAAGVIESQVGSRAGWTSTAKQEFRGFFSELFSDNQLTAKDDANEVATRLREVATFTGQLADEAQEEQDRRNQARQWKQDQEDRGWLEKGWDWVTDGNDAPVPDMPEPSNFTPEMIPPRPRQTPTAGSGGGGTSSARPADLRTFADGSSGANSALAGKPAACRNAYDSFVAGCGWGSLQASSVFAGFTAYLEANREDVQWVRTVAAAFEEAGGSGAVSTLSDSALGAALQAKGIDASRQDIVIDPPLAYGNPPTSGYADDPVNAATGNFIENEVDLAFSGGCDELALARTYNSFDTGSGAFGPGWSSALEAGLELGEDSARLQLPDGRSVVFPRLGDGWDRALGENLWLVREGDLQVVSDNDGSRWVHAASGHLLQMSQGAGTAVDLRRGPQGQVVRLEHERGRAIDLTWDDAGERVVAAAGGPGLEATYAYEAGRLVAVTTRRGTRCYRWDDDGVLDRVTDADGVVEAENVYDHLRRVTTQRSQHGRVSRFVYLPGGTTEVADVDGTRSNTWISDGRGRLVGVVDSDGRRQSFAYDTHGNRVMVTARDGSTTIRSHDERGRVRREVLPEGADLTYAHDDADRLLTVVTASGGVVEYSYTGDQRQPSVMIDPEGGRTEMTWVDGLLTRVVDPTGVTVELAHDAHGDLVAMTDGEGRTARLERDDEGRVVSSTTPMGHRTTYSWAPTGLLASRRDPDGGVWRFEHTTAGRLSAVVDPTGSRTVVEHDEAGEESRVVDPLGRAVRRRHDDLGNLASVELPDGSTWRYGHDALSRLTEVVDPTGATWQADYDAVGRPTATTDPTGRRCTIATDVAANTVTVDAGAGPVTTRFDPLGRPVDRTTADGGAVMATYDRCGRPVELLDAEGALTLVERDAAGRPLRVTDPEGVVTSYEYDACGRLAAVVDGTGGRTTREHDADGRLVAVTLPSGEVHRTEHDACGRVVAVHRPGAGVARYRYDAAGRLVESSDTWNGRRRFRYDAAGQLVEATSGTGHTTRYEHDVLGRTVAITDPLGNTVRREFDALGRCVAETDPLGRTTRAAYDEAGRQLWQEDPDGRRIAYGYDAAGRFDGARVDGRTMAVAEDLGARRSVLTEQGPDGETSTVELQRDRCGRLVRRTRDGAAVAWTYDRAGRRTSMTAPDGTVTAYSYDRAGRLETVEHPTLGRVSMSRDAAGRLVGLTAAGATHTWEHLDGAVVAHVASRDGVDDRRTSVERDEDGRITALETVGRRTELGYDEARQLVEARSEGSVRQWRYDAAGRLVAETVDGTRFEHTVDAAGQLLATAGPDGLTEHSYDGAGRRVLTRRPDGSRRELTWTASGWLSGIAETGSDGARTEVPFHVDATGLLVAVGDVELHWDAAAAVPAPVLVGGVGVFSAGPLTAVGGTWVDPGWRTARATGADPWSVDAVGGLLDDLPGGLVVAADGGLGVAGMEWLGARVYDPASRGFLSVDPLEPVPGAGWAGNPYSYAGNDPLHALDPMGLKPLTDQELAAYNAANNTGLGAVKKFVEDHAVVIGVIVAIAGVAMVATGVGGPAGMMLISAGADMAIQKATTGDVKWGQVAVSGAMGFAGGAAGSYAAQAGMQGGRLVAFNVGTNAAIGGVGETANYAMEDGPVTARGLTGAFLGGSVTGAAMGGSNAAGDAFAASRGLTGIPERVVSHGAGGLIDAGGGFGGSVTQQYVTDGRVDVREAAYSGATSAAAGAGADLFEGGVGKSEAAYNPRHSTEGGAHRANGFFDHRSGAAGADSATGTIVESAIDKARGDD